MRIAPTLLFHLLSNIYRTSLENYPVSYHQSKLASELVKTHQHLWDKRRLRGQGSGSDLWGTSCIQKNFITTQLTFCFFKRITCQWPEMDSFYFFNNTHIQSLLGTSGSHKVVHDCVNFPLIPRIIIKVGVKQWIGRETNSWRHSNAELQRTSQFWIMDFLSQEKQLQSMFDVYVNCM